MKVRSGKERGQMSAICQPVLLVMTFTWPVIEAVGCETADRIDPGMADHEHTNGSMLLPGGCCTFSSEIGRLAARFISDDLKKEEPSNSNLIFF